MRSTRFFQVVITLWLAWMLQGCASTESASPAATAPAPARITVLYDAFGKNAATTKDWGYAALVEVNGKRILFDTGDNPEIFARNVKAKGVDLKNLDFVVMSHRYGDHMGGMDYLLNVNPKVKIYAPTEVGGVYGFSFPSASYRKNASLPAEQRYYDGTPPQVIKLGSAWPSANLELIDKTTQITPDMWLIALVSDAPGTKELKELSLAIDTPDGMVLVVGCSHPGIEPIVAEAAKINPRIHLIAGGFHLAWAQDPTIEKATTALHDTYKVDYIAPGHCTGEPTFAALQKAFGDRYLYAGLGTTLGVGANPRTESDRTATHTLDESDLQSYRTLLAQSDDVKDSGHQTVRLVEVN
jgi:7,8-dihydropterin-6-yl-methyl-4-(beta-D-ribofuranosyl)aminobenzene 5'-phosphate synthase